MAVAFLSTATYISPSSSTLSSPSVRSNNITTAQVPLLSKAELKESSSSSSFTNQNPIILTKRQLALGLTASSFLLTLSGAFSKNSANAAILEADEDDELMERIKKDRQKRIDRQGFINSSKKETGYLQEVVYKLSEVGQAIEKNDLNAASSVLGPNTETDWIKKANSAFTKLSSGPQEKAEVDTFNTSMANLISSVGQGNVESSKVAFVVSASAFEKWALLSGLGENLKGL